ncbi:MAG: hypothetical protein MI866_11815, partial [Bacteroidales bacterium]|nr:hypothetical protein [Bacteroidales bacterium]
QNMVKQFGTDAVNIISTDKFGSNITGNMQITINEDNTVELASSDVVINSYDCSYQVEENSFYMDVNLTKAGTTYQVLDTLILRQAPGKDLRFEEW